MNSVVPWRSFSIWEATRSTRYPESAEVKVIPCAQAMVTRGVVVETPHESGKCFVVLTGPNLKGAGLRYHVELYPDSSVRGGMCF